MAIKKGLKDSLNQIRELSTPIYHQEVPVINDETSINEFGRAILESKVIQNEFVSALINRIAYTQFEVKYFNNPLQDLEGDSIPLGYIGQEGYVNPATARKYNADDFAGLLRKYEADVKIQYMNINMDLQYPVTVNRNKLKDAFVSWDELERFIDEFSNSLYNGAYIDEFRYTKMLVSTAYKENAGIIENISAPTTEELAKAFVTKARELFLNFQLPSSNYNSWHKLNGYGRPVVTWTNPEDIVFLIRNDIRAYLDVNVLASAFNIDKTTLLGNIKPVDNFNIYDDDGVMIFDGSKILGIIADKKWFRIRRRDMFLDEFYNPNNRTWQYYLNLTKMYNYSLFANHTILATETPSITITGLNYNDTKEITLDIGDKEGLDINVLPAGANTPKITYSKGEMDTDIYDIEEDENDNRHITVIAKQEGNGTITAKAGSAQVEIGVKVNPASEAISLKLNNAKKVTTTAKAKATTKAKTTTDNVLDDFPNDDDFPIDE